MWQAAAGGADSHVNQGANCKQPPTLAVDRWGRFAFRHAQCTTTMPPHPPSCLPSIRVDVGIDPTGTKVFLMSRLSMPPASAAAAAASPVSPSGSGAEARQGKDSSGRLQVGGLGTGAGAGAPPASAAVSADFLPAM